MYSHMNVLLISRNSVTIHFNDGKQYEVKISGYFDFTRKLDGNDSVFYPGETLSTSVTITANAILVRHFDNNLRIHFPEEVRYQVCKDVAKGQVFALNYRKHLRQWFSRDQMTFIVLPQAEVGNGSHDHSQQDLERFCLEIRQEARKFSEGRNNKPIVIISPNGFGSISASIYKDEKLVLTQNFFQ